MPHNQMISIEDDLFLNHKFRSLKKQKKLSDLFCKLMREHLNITDDEIPQEIIQLDDELMELSARKASLLMKKEKILEDIEKSKPKVTYHG